MQDAAKFWDKVAKKYAKSPVRDMDAYTYTLDRTRAYLSANDKVLEVGCGTGSTALVLAADTGRIKASDLSGKMIEIATQKARDQGVSNVEFVKADLFDDRLEDGPYDVVLAFNILHLLEDISSAVQRINGLLKPGGTFISKTVCEPGKGTPLKWRLLLTILPIMQFFGKAPYVNFMTIAELEETISSRGFKIVETGNYPAAPPSRFIVAKKI